jgi:hypothetical protein
LATALDKIDDFNLNEVLGGDREAGS